MRQHIIELKKLMKTKKAEIDKLKPRPAPSTERELYLLSEIEFIGRQLESEHLEACYSFRVCPQLCLSLIFPLLLAAFNIDWQAENLQGSSALHRKRKGTPWMRSTSGPTLLKPRS